MSSFSNSDNIYIPRSRLSINSLSPTPNTATYLKDCYGVSWDKNKSKKKDSISICGMSPPSKNTARLINSFVGSKVFKQSFSEENI